MKTVFVLTALIAGLFSFQAETYGEPLVGDFYQTLPSRSTDFLIIEDKPSAEESKYRNLPGVPESGIPKTELHQTGLKKNPYADIKYLDGLYCSPLQQERAVGYLAIDTFRRPAIYLALNGGKRCASLSKHSRLQIDQHWSAKKKKGPYQLYYLKQSCWCIARIDLKFKDNHCTEFKVSCPDTANSWFEADKIPTSPYKKLNGKLVLPPWIGRVEPPQDMPDCGPVSSVSTCPLAEKSN